jgi:alkylation response protein AidB-like acyl-CoA dehydrogenase
MKLPEECVMIKQLAKRFVEEELIPLEQELEENGDLSPETWVTLKKKAAAVGLYMCTMPKEYGGGEISWLAAIGVWEEFGRVPPVFERTILTNPGAEVMQLKLPNQDQLERFFLPLMRAEKTMCFALTEPEAGNDVSMLKTKAVKQGGQWIINGSKTFITLAPKADFCLVFAVSDPSKGVRDGTSCFIVEKDTPGFRVERTPKYMGSTGFKSSDIVFEDCAVPEANLLGRENGAYREILGLLGASRILGGAMSLGVAKRSLEIATDYALNRVTWGKPLAARQYVQGMLVEASLQIYATECMLYDAAWEATYGKQDPVTQAMVKLFANEMAANVSEKAMRVCGGHGYTKDMPLERMYRDTRGIMIADGASEILKLIIATRLVGRKYTFEA